MFREAAGDSGFRVQNSGGSQRNGTSLQPEQYARSLKPLCRTTDTFRNPPPPAPPKPPDLSPRSHHEAQPQTPPPKPSTLNGRSPTSRQPCSDTGEEKMFKSMEIVESEPWIVINFLLSWLQGTGCRAPGETWKQRASQPCGSEGNRLRSPRSSKPKTLNTKSYTLNFKP